jgi:hypothetical protein
MIEQQAEWRMRKPIGSFVPAVSAGVLAAVAATILPGSATLAAGNCLANPGKSAADGMRWRYRVDHANNDRHCWYLRAQGAVRHAVRLHAAVKSPAKPETDAEAQPAAAMADARPAPPPQPAARDASLERHLMTWWVARSKPLDASEPEIEILTASEPEALTPSASAADSFTTAAAATVAATPFEHAAGAPELAALTPAPPIIAPEQIGAVLVALALAGLAGRVIARRSARRRFHRHLAFGGFVAPGLEMKFRSFAGSVTAVQASEPSDRSLGEPGDLAVVLAAARRAGLATETPGDHLPTDYAPRARRGASSVLWVDDPLDAAATRAHPLAVEEDALNRFLRDWEFHAA